MDEQTLQMDTPHDDGGALPPPGTASPEPPRPWYRVPVSRDRDEGHLGGVVAGVSAAYGFDRRTTSIAVVIAALVLPVVVPLYIAAWVLLPPTPAEAQSLEAILRDRRRVPLYVAIGIVLVAATFGSMGSWWVFGTASWGVALIAVGVLLWASPALRSSTPAPVGTESYAVREATAPSTELAPPARRRRAIPIASITAAAALVGVAIAAGGDGADWWNVTTLGVVAAAGVAVALGCFVSTVVNRAWYLIPVAMVVAAATTMLLVFAPRLDDGVGNREVRPVSSAAVTERLGLGELTIDLRSTALDGTDPMMIVAEVGIGRLDLIVPDDARVVLHAEIGGGAVSVDGREVLEGVRQETSLTLEPFSSTAATAATAFTIDLDLRVGMGEIFITHAPST